ncbi:hypothetical protein [Bradyrhizobium prioriisuperbiae]|uniref:hypothetical protein n=1 Tax=Bradyrhizobium prioriisuperbiae TaxID=2854389 RepID=UPI0028EC8513|nr:hypothetical protein [Bradyrhizobium prioritasuperba]
MPVPSRLQYPADIEPLVNFIEETPTEVVVERLLEKLRNGLPLQTALTASALAVTRSTDMPSQHHGGPLHSLAGLYATSKLAHRLDGERRFIPVLQHVVLSNKNIRHPAMGPYQLLEFEPLDAGGVEATKSAFQAAVAWGDYNHTDHLFLSLWSQMPTIKAFDLLISVAIRKNFHDDHYFILPGLLWRAFETGVIDKRYLPLLMRPVVRYVTRHPIVSDDTIASPMPAIDALIEKHELLTRVLRQKTGDDETHEIGRLGEALGRCDDYGDIPPMIADALARGLSIEGAGEALSIGACSLFLRSQTGNPMDVHLHTSANLRRYLLGVDGLSVSNKLLLLLTWHTGPEIRLTQSRMDPAQRSTQPTAPSEPGRSQAGLLDAIIQSIHAQPPTDWSKVVSQDLMLAVPEVKTTVNLTQYYVQHGYNSEALIGKLAEIACHDDFTETHAVKHHQSIVEEFHTTREPWRWMHLVCGAKAAAISFGKSTAVYEEYLKLATAA